MKIETEEALLEMARKLGTSIEHLYETLTKQAKVWMFKAIIDCIIWTVSLVIFIIISLHQHYTPAINYDMCSFSTLKLIFCWLFTIIIGIIIISNAGDKISDIYQAIYNPEFFAFRELTNLL